MLLGFVCQNPQTFFVVLLRCFFVLFFVLTKTEQLMCSKSFKFVEQRGQPGSLEFSTLKLSSLMEVHIHCRGTTQTNRNNHVVSS